MEPIAMTVKEFVEKIGRPRGMTVDFIERNIKAALDCGHDWRIYVGNRPDVYSIKVDAIKAYFDEKNKPADTAPAPNEEVLEDFLSTSPSSPAAEGKKGGKK